MTTVALSPARATPRRSLRPISVISASTLNGCNILHTGTVVRLRVDLGRWTEQLSEQFAQRFSERFLGLPRLVVEPLRTIRFCDRLLTESDTPALAEILLEGIVAVENAVAARMHRLDTVEYATVADAGPYVELRWSSQSPSLSKLCAAAAIEGINEILGAAPTKRATPSPVRFEEQFAALERLAVSRRLTTTVSVIRDAAKARGIPVAYVGGSYLRLGQGKYQTYFRGSVTGKTSHAASQMSIDKRLATKTLRLQGLPVPKHAQVKNAAAAADEAGRLGLPVVVKPIKGHGGAGVSIVQDPADIAAAYKRAAKEGSGVLVEQFIEGRLFRLLVINKTMVAALRTDLPQITGDGVRSVAQLIQGLNLEPLRDDFRLVPIALDDALARLLAKSSVDFDTVLAPGRTVLLRTVANVAQGGFAVDVTNDVHPDNARVAVQAARVIGLDVAGIDFLTPDIARSYKRVGGAIIEVNGRPGLGMHVWPQVGQSRDVGGAVVDMMYPTGSRASIDTVFVVGDRRTAVVARDLDALLRDMKRTVGLTIKSRVFTDGERKDIKGRKPARGIRTLLREPDVDCMIATAAPASIVERGLLVTNVDIAAITAPSKETDLQTYRRGLDVVMAAKPKRLVVGAENPLAAHIVERLGAKRVTLVSRIGLTQNVRAHLELGGHAVLTRWVGGRRYIEIHGEEKLIVSLPVTGGAQVEQGPAKDHESAVSSTGQRSQRIETRLFAVALAAALDQPITSVADALARAPLSIR
jgi:cyanophycin synthetase